MDKHDPYYTLRQIRSHAEEIVSISRGKTHDAIENDRLLNLALTRLVEIIGEAAGRIPEKFQEEHPDLPWHQMIAARNRLIHGYDNVDLDILWAIVHADIPILIIQINNILSQSEGI